MFETELKDVDYNGFFMMIWLFLFIILGFISYVLYKYVKSKKVTIVKKIPKKKTAKLKIQSELTRAISVRQPYAELIMMGLKQEECRNVPTNIRGRIYIYASNTLEKDEVEIKKTMKAEEELIRGFLIGTVEITDCLGSKIEGYRWQLKNPIRLEKLVKPLNKPQPVWFKPF